MRQIQKGNECKALSRWRKDNASVPQNLVYGKGGFPSAEVLAALLTEQGDLCAYTLKRIGPTSAHIEHLKPRTECRKEDEQREVEKSTSCREDVAWNNMVACFPAPNAPKPTYGAVFKDGWWPSVGASGFVSPLGLNCEGRFHFELSGAMKPTDPTDAAAEQTIGKIGLNDSRLQELRRQAFIELGLHPRSEKPLVSPTKVKQLIADWHQRDANSQFKEFCVPLRAVALKHLAKLEGRAKKGTA